MSLCCATSWQANLSILAYHPLPERVLEGNEILRELLRAAVQKLEYEEELVKRAREVLEE